MVNKDATKVSIPTKSHCYFPIHSTAFEELSRLGIRVRDPSLNKFEIVSCIPRRKMSAYEVDMKYGRQIQYNFFCCNPRRKEKDNDIKLDLAGITNVPDNTHFS